MYKKHYAFARGVRILNYQSVLSRHSGSFTHLDAGFIFDSKTQDFCLLSGFKVSPQVGYATKR